MCWTLILGLLALGFEQLLILPKLQLAVTKTPTSSQPFRRVILTSQNPNIDAFSQTVKTVDRDSDWSANPKLKLGENEKLTQSCKAWGD